MADKKIIPVQFWDSDIVGQRIHVGSIIAYGHSLGRCAALRIGKILAINTVHDRKYSYVTKQNDIEISAHFTVWGIDRGWGNDLDLCKTKGTLQFADRMVVLQPSQVNREILELLDLVSLDTTYKKLAGQIAVVQKNAEARAENREIFAPLIQHAKSLGLDQ